LISKDSLAAHEDGVSWKALRETYNVIAEEIKDPKEVGEKYREKLPGLVAERNAQSSGIDVKSAEESKPGLR
jgi:hypothetical protein